MHIISILWANEYIYLTHHFHSAKDMAKMVATLQILGNVSKSAEVIWILSSTRNVPDLVLRHNRLTDRNQMLSNGDRVDQMQTSPLKDQ